MTQGERILQYMRDFGSITPMEAFRDLGITKLSTRVGELERQGHRIIRKPVESLNRYGEKTRYMSYSMERSVTA